jgi:hypothetical protein
MYLCECVCQESYRFDSVAGDDRAVSGWRAECAIRAQALDFELHG